MRITAAPLLLATSLILSACATDEGGELDAEGDAFTSADGKADGYDLTEPEALAVMTTSAALTEADLRAEAGVTSRAAAGIAAYVAGADRRRGTADDQAFDSLAELDAIAYVGPRTLELLLEHARATGTLDEGGLGRHDVSILLPLPTTGDLPWTAATPGRGGALLPATVFAKVGRSLVREVTEDAEYAALRVVGVRFDPCFQTSLTAACQPQLRLVFQTLGAVGANDGAVHALYNLSATQHAEVTARLRELVALAPQNRAYAPLGVSPALRAQGMDGAYGTALGELIAAYAGPATLARMTFMTRNQARQGQWEFGGVHVKATAATGFPAAGPITMVGSTETLQVVSNGGFGGFRFNVTPSLADAAGEVGLDGSVIPTLSASAKQTLAAWTAAQNSPVLTVPDTTDCTSCHVAGHVTGALERAAPTLVSVDRGPRVIGAADGMGDNLRAFGYFAEAAQVSIRTANETAAVLRAFDAAR